MRRFQAFAASPLLRSFTPDEVAEIYNTGQTDAAGPGKRCSGGAIPGDSMFVVLSGRIQLVFPSEISPKVLRSGDFLGELALVSPDHVRTATAIGLDDAELQLFDQRAFDRLLETKPEAAGVAAQVDLPLPAVVRAAPDLRLPAQEPGAGADPRPPPAHPRRARPPGGPGPDRRADRAAQPAVHEPGAGAADRAPRRTGRAGGAAHRPRRLQAINDTHGHPCGDAVLGGVAGILRTSVRPMDLPCRIGGDEFAVVFPSVNRARQLPGRRHPPAHREDPSTCAASAAG